MLHTNEKNHSMFLCQFKSDEISLETINMIFILLSSANVGLGREKTTPTVMWFEAY